MKPFFIQTYSTVAFSCFKQCHFVTTGKISCLNGSKFYSKSSLEGSKNNNKNCNTIIEELSYFWGYFKRINSKRILFQKNFEIYFERRIFTTTFASKNIRKQILFKTNLDLFFLDLTITSISLYFYKKLSMMFYRFRIRQK